MGIEIRKGIMRMMRKREIIKFLANQPNNKIAEDLFLAWFFNCFPVSDMTVDKDLDILKRMGIIQIETIKYIKYLPTDRSDHLITVLDEIENEEKNKKEDKKSYILKNINEVKEEEGCEEKNPLPNYNVDISTTTIDDNNSSL